MAKIITIIQIFTIIMLFIFVIVTDASYPCKIHRDCTTITCSYPLVPRCLIQKCYCGFN
ncbi:putative Late nodulin [Medicago truncatula]|uniref:Putative Late nodulin n=1 Tax=Medicago truncatula TaxID=3880 RepID=I3SDC4_MEDTR|nr:unknown [Medicago truncatula]RHN73612.1 putative Late nodulin [Medicago truncatula]